MAAEWLRQRAADRRVPGATLSGDRLGGETFLAAAGVTKDGEGKEAEQPDNPGGLVERIAYAFACEKLAERAARYSAATPDLSFHRRGYERLVTELEHSARSTYPGVAAMARPTQLE